MTSPATIAVCYASVGSGHRIAAEAIAEELSNRPEVARVQLLDVLDFSPKRMTGDRLATAFTGPWAKLYDKAWASPALGAIGRFFSGGLYHLIMPGFARMLHDLSPDVVVCTHAAPAVIAAREVRRGRATWKLVCSATDFGLHGYWPVVDADLFCVADERSARVALDRGASPDAVHPTGIAIRSQFAAALDRDASRSELGLPADGVVIVALAGSTMAGPYAPFKRALTDALPTLCAHPQTTTVVVTGSDARFASHLRDISGTCDDGRVRVEGFVERMAPLLEAADLVIAKPGGSICAECLASGVGMILVGPAVGQEAANMRALGTAGAARCVSAPGALADAAGSLICAPAELGAMRATAVELGRRTAARDIAALTVSLLA